MESDIPERLPASTSGSRRRPYLSGVMAAGLAIVTLLLFVGSLPSAEAQEPPDPAAIDVTISLYNIPLTPDERRPYEHIMQHFANAIYEASNGAQVIGTVTIYTGARFSDKADVIWVDDCWPNAQLSGWGKSGLHINMCDEFDNDNFLDLSDDEAGAKKGGYALAHEWGHYYYSLKDEYAADYDGYFSPHLNDDDVKYSIMNAPFCAEHTHAISNTVTEGCPDEPHERWLNFSTAKNDTQKTAQYRLYGASAWETLARPLDQDGRNLKNWRRLLQRKRIYHPELSAAGTAPDRDDLPRIDLTGTLSITPTVVWVSGDVTALIVIDHSSSMGSENKMESAKAAARLLVDLAAVEHTNLGVIEFSSRVNVVQPLTAIDSQETKDEIEAEIDKIQASGGTAIGDAAHEALEDLLAYGAEDTNRVVYLLTDGKNGGGRDPLSVIPAYQAARVPLFTFAYGSGADTSLLRKVAEDTGGKTYSSPTEAGELIEVFQDAQQLTFPSVGLTSETDLVWDGSTESYTITVDPAITALEVVVVHDKENDLDEAVKLKLSLIEPNGSKRHKFDCSDAGTERLCFAHLDDPASGNWTLEATASGGYVYFRLRASGSAESTITYSAAVNSLSGHVVQYPEPILILATVGREMPMSGAIVTGTLERPDGSTQAFPLRDDGLAPDAVADDGLYSAILNYTDNGAYNVSVQFDNSAGTAALTEISFEPSLGPDGLPVPYADPVPVNEDFERFARIQVNVEHVQPDDHGNTPQDATFLAATNDDMPGKIDYQGDLDVFRIDVANPGDLSVRVSNLALGMDPRLRLIGSDMTTVLGEADLSSGASSRGYLNVIHPMPAAGTVYAEVSHRTGGAEGFYDISAGAQIAGDGPDVPTPTPSPTPPPPTPQQSTPEYVVPPGSTSQTGGGGGLALILLLGLLIAGLVIAVIILVVRQQSGGAGGRAGVMVSGDPQRTAGFRQGVLRIGRDPSSELPLSDTQASRMHARIVQTPQGYVIEDLRSTNGTKVNGQEITSQQLYPNDQIEIGNTRLIFWVR